LGYFGQNWVKVNKIFFGKTCHILEVHKKT